MPELLSIEPATGAQVWRGPTGDVRAEVAAARQALPHWMATPLANRMEALRRFGNELRKANGAFAQLLARETGRPLWEVRSEVESAIARVESAILAYAERSAQRRLDSALAGTVALRHRPVGVLAVITPFCTPLAIAAAHCIPALLAGNAVVLKPSERTPAVGAKLVECFRAAGLPEGVVRLLQGGPDIGKALALADGVDGVLFTGSAPVGLDLNRAFANRPDRLLSLSLGGNNAIVVTKTPKISDAAMLVIQSAFASAGQLCTAASRLIVDETIADALLAEVKTLADRLIIGAPFDDPAPFMGPVIDNVTADGLSESFLWLISNGGKAIKHLARRDPDLPFLSPAIVDVTGMAERPDIELFGPLLQVIRVEGLDGAIAEANATRFGLCVSLVGGTPQDYSRFWGNVRAGVVNWNRATTTVSPNAPLGGIGLSGNHRAGGSYLADQCAYPVTSAEAEQPRASIGIGLRS